MKQKFYVLNWDFNSDRLIHYDVLPYFREVYKEHYDQFLHALNKKWWKEADEETKKCYKIPETFAEFKDFIRGKAMYQFWARCEYEMICHGWPVRKNEYKLDVYEQIEMNLDIIAEILWKEIKK